MSVLEEILRTKRDEVARLSEPDRHAAVRAAAEAASPPRAFEAALRRGDQLAVIAEIKRRSPSKGALAPDLDAGALATAYARAGAACLSVLTDGPFFGGSAADLGAARLAASATPVLRKDFTIDPVQIEEARGMGADAVLLIVAAVSDDARLAELQACAHELGIAAMVEVHDERELERALDAGARIVGVNARDLGTFTEDLAVGERLVGRIPSGVVAVAESAIRATADARRMADAGFDAVLVGEGLVRAVDPEAWLGELSRIPRSARRAGRAG